MNLAEEETIDLAEEKMPFEKPKLFFIILFCLATILFFSPRFLDYSYQYYLYYLHFLAAAAFIAYNNRWLKNDSFTIPFLFILVGIFVSGLVSSFSWGQSMFKSITSILPYLSYLLYFLLMVWKFKVEDVEKVIPVLGFLFAGAYIIAFVTYPNSLFGGIYAEMHNDERGFQRIVMPGVGFLFLFSFFSISKYYRQKELKWLMIFFFSIILIVGTLTRSLMVGSFALLTLYILRSSRIVFKLLAIVIVSVIVILITQLEMFQNMKEMTVAQFEYYETDFRYMAARFFLTEFSPNLPSKIFGNGLSGVDTWYGLYIQYLARRLGFYTSDIGYIGLYVVHGIVTVAGFFILIYRVIRIKVPREQIYSKYFLYFVFLVSIIVDAPFNIYWIPSIVLAAYILTANNKGKLQPAETI